MPVIRLSSVVGQSTSWVTVVGTGCPIAMVTVSGAGWIVTPLRTWIACVRCCCVSWRLAPPDSPTLRVSVPEPVGAVAPPVVVVVPVFVPVPLPAVPLPVVPVPAVPAPPVPAPVVPVPAAPLVAPPDAPPVVPPVPLVAPPDVPPAAPPEPLLPLAPE